MSARSRRPTGVLTSMLSSRCRASSGASTGVLPRFTTCLGPRTAVAGLQECRATRLLADASACQAVHPLIVGQELEEPLLHSLNCIPCETGRKPEFSVALDCRTMSSRAAPRKCGSHDGDPHHPSMAGFSVAELLEANPAIVSAEVLWVAPAIVVGWGI